MPVYSLHCEACDHRFEVFLRVSERQYAKCERCGATRVETDPSQFQAVAIQRTWARGRGGSERKSMGLAFQESGIGDVKRDCPSMDFEVKGGVATPVYHNDAHHRRCMKELNAAGTRYKAEIEAKREARLGRVNKKEVVKSWLKKSKR